VPVDWAGAWTGWTDCDSAVGRSVKARPNSALQDVKRRIAREVGNAMRWVGLRTITLRLTAKLENSWWATLSFAGGW